MIRNLLMGTVLAFCAAPVLLIGGGSDLEHIAVLGAVLGGVVGLVPHEPLLGKLGGFASGFVIAWIVVGVRALLLPDTTIWRAVAAFLVIFLCGAVAAVSADRLPLRSALVGVAAMVGAYETSFTNSPPQFLTTSPPAATAVLLAAGFGFIGVTIVATFFKVPDAARARSAPGARWRPRLARACHDRRDQMKRKSTHTRIGTAFVLAPAVLLLAGGPVLAGGRAPAGGPALGGDNIVVSNAETVQARLNANGTVRSARIYEQIALQGNGSVIIANLVSTNNL